MRLHLLLLIFIGLCSVFSAHEHKVSAEEKPDVKEESEGKELVEEGEEKEGEHEEEEKEGHEEEGGEEEGEEEEEEEEEVNPVDLTSACFLLGGVVFVVSLFYLVNHSDKDIREHSWKVISETISIFVSVLIFQAINGVLDKFLFAHMSHLADIQVLRLCIAYMEFALFYSSLHLTMRTFAFLTAPEEKQSIEEFEERRELKMATWSKIFGHMSGFAVIRCILELQHFQNFEDSAVLCFLAVLLNAALLFGLFRFSDWLRSRPPYFIVGENNEGYYRWEEGAEESENDLSAIGLSFAACVVIRFMVSGCLVDRAGLEIPAEEHTFKAKMTLGVLSIIFAISSSAIILIDAAIHPKKDGHAVAGRMTLVGNNESGVDHFSQYVRRWVFISSSTLATISAWCAMYFAKWCLFSYMLEYTTFHNPNACMQRVVLAMVVSAGSMGLVFFFDKLKDMECTKEAADTAIKAIIQALAILIGFAWESAFDSGVEAISELTVHNGEWVPIWVKLTMAFTMAIVTIPAWRMYILPHTMPKKEEDHSPQEVKKEEYVALKPGEA